MSTTFKGVEQVKVITKIMIGLHWMVAIVTGNKQRADYMQYLWTVFYRNRG